MMRESGSASPLGDTRLFGHIGARALDTLERAGRTQTFGKGDLLFRRGEKARYFFLVLSGWVRVYRDRSAGEQAVLGVFGPGESVAEAAFFLGGSYPASAEAAENTRLLAVPQGALTGLIADDPSVAMAMMGSMAQHLRGLVNDVERLKTRNGEQRLGLFILEMCRSGPSGCSVDLPYEKSLIAGRLGMRPESLSRAFARLDREGVRLDGNRVTVTDIRRLEDFCQMAPRRRSSSPER